MTNLNGKQIVLTGGSGGIGEEVLLRLAQAGAKILIVGRSADNARAAIERAQRSAPNASVDFFQADLSLMREVQRLSDYLHNEYEALDAIVHGAGVMLPERILTDEGIETVFAVQYLARYLLTNATLDLLHAADAPQVVNISAGGEVNMELNFDNLNGEQSYDGVTALRHESVANDMLMLEFAERVEGITFYCYGPGFVPTGLMRDMPWWLRWFSNTLGRLIATTPAQAAEDIVGLLQGDDPGGLYARHRKRNTPGDFKADDANRQRLWRLSEEMVTRAHQTAPDDRVTSP